MALIERRQILEYNLNGPRRFWSLSGWLWRRIRGSLRIGGRDGLVWLAALWAGGPVGRAYIRLCRPMGAVFLLTGLFEECSFRGYLQYTLTRGINFWWALGIIGAVCQELPVKFQRQRRLGRLHYCPPGLDTLPVAASEKGRRLRLLAGGLGHFHPLRLHYTLATTARTGIGIFAAAFVGFVFCVSVRVTGSAWWAIGCHAPGTGRRPIFTAPPTAGWWPPATFNHHTNATASVLWSGGADGPEGKPAGDSIILLLLLAILVLYGRGKQRRRPLWRGRILPAHKPRTHEPDCQAGPIVRPFRYTPAAGSSSRGRDGVLAPKVEETCVCCWNDMERRGKGRTYARGLAGYDRGGDTGLARNISQRARHGRRERNRQIY